MLVAIDGHVQAQHMVQTQPMKMAAAEALWNSQDPASFSLFTVGNLQGSQEIFSIRVPDLLSILAYNGTTGEVKGINQLQTLYSQRYGPGDYIPPVGFIYWMFRLMVGAGMLMILLSLYDLFLAMRRKLERSRWFLSVLIGALFLPYLANTAGWLMTELGRQPWIVFGLLKTQQAVSPTATAGSVLFSLIAFALLYGALMVVDVYLLAKFARDSSDKTAPATEEALALEAY
jgi:cytochrome d ubiquinol oxidase subunit I